MCVPSSSNNQRVSVTGKSSYVADMQVSMFINGS